MYIPCNYFNPSGCVRKNTAFMLKMTDMFDNKVICKNCDKEMQKVKILKNGFLFRALRCIKCGERILHPEDEMEYKNYLNLRKKSFSVKLRMVGNSYTVSIPKEIVNFINEQNKMIDDIVRLNFENMGKLSLVFGDLNEKLNQRRKKYG